MAREKSSGGASRAVSPKSAPKPPKRAKTSPKNIPHGGQNGSAENVPNWGQPTPVDERGPVYFSPEEQLRRLANHARAGVNAIRLLIGRLRTSVPHDEAWALTDGLMETTRAYYDAMAAVMDLAAGHLPPSAIRSLRDHRDAFELGMWQYRSAAESVQELVREQAVTEQPPRWPLEDPAPLDIDPADVVNTRSHGERMIAMALAMLTTVQAHDGFVPTDFQRDVLTALIGTALSSDELARKADFDRSRIYGKEFKELRTLGKVKHRHGLGFYRPDRPPPPP